MGNQKAGSGLSVIVKLRGFKVFLWKIKLGVMNAGRDLLQVGRIRVNAQNKNQLYEKNLIC